MVQDVWGAIWDPFFIKAGAVSRQQNQTVPPKVQSIYTGQLMMELYVGRRKTSQVCDVTAAQGIVPFRRRSGTKPIAL